MLASCRLGVRAAPGQRPSTEYHEFHSVYIGRAQHPADVLRSARPVQPDGCEFFRHR